MSEAELTLRQKRVLFTRCLVALLEHAIDNPHGIEVVLDQTKRTQAEANANAASGSGIKNSLHLLGLAADLILYREGKPVTDSADYEWVGRFWCSLHPLCCWGGDFSKPDGGHMSVTHGGVK